LLQKLTAAGWDTLLLDFPAGEKSKNIDTVSVLQTQMLMHGIRRDSLIVALGGGVVGDVAGFVASTVLRGVRYVHVPTTLLAQIDSSVGGKVGINHPLGKNLVGAFHQPAAVFVDPGVLRTLPALEFRNGLSELIKTAAVMDKALFGQIERNAGKIGAQNVSLLEQMIARAVRLKASVVERDEFDSGLRKILNFGHTIGHALEVTSHYALRHGAAVAIGMAAESRIAVNMGLMKEKDCRRLANVIRMVRLPTQLPRIRSASKLLKALSADKKTEDGSTKFVLLKGFGNPIVGVDVPSPFIVEMLKS
jgi:3-dehydroquinate synthase